MYEYRQIADGIQTAKVGTWEMGFGMLWLGFVKG